MSDVPVSGRSYESIHLPEPECMLGYTRSQLVDILGTRLGEFDHWMRGQTMALCEGTRWDPALRATVRSGCGPHGPAVYGHDLRRFLGGLPVVD